VPSKQNDANDHDLWVLLHKIVDHAWNGPDKDSRTLEYRPKHRQEFLDKGIRTQAELFDIVRDGIDRKDTRAIREESNEQRGRVLGKEVFAIPLRDANGKSYDLFVAINRDVKDGRLLGGTCFVPQMQDYFNKQVKLEVEKRQITSPTSLEAKDIVVIGGRPALREQESHRQLVVVDRQAQENEAQKRTLRSGAARHVKRRSPRNLQPTIAKDSQAVQRERNQDLKPEVNTRANETLAERWQRERAERAQQGEKSQSRSHEQPRTQGGESLAERWQRERVAQQQDSGPRDMQIQQERQQREREHDR
jgi:hypothetical protein